MTLVPNKTDAPDVVDPETMMFTSLHRQRHSVLLEGGPSYAARLLLFDRTSQFVTAADRRPAHG